MKNLKKLLLLLLSLSISFSLFSCSLFGKSDGGKDDDDEEICEEHEDDDEDCICDLCDEELHEDDDDDGVCDYCDEELESKGDGGDGNEDPEDEVVLIENEDINFQIVYEAGLSNEVYQRIDYAITKVLRNDFDVNVNVVKDGSADDEEEEIEILIGDIKSRGNGYFLDEHTLGKKGYAIKVVGSKIIINAGTESLLMDTIDMFAEDVLMLEEDYLEDVVFTTNDNIVEIQDDYKITELIIDDTDMRDYTIAVDMNNEYLLGGALTFQDSIYARTGYWFDIVDIDDADDESIIFKTKNKVYGAADGFLIYTSGGKLIVECAFENMCERAVTKFITSKILSAPAGEFVFDGEIYEQDISFVTYEDFGAKGDGKTDDFQAIYDTHVFANISGQIVKAAADARYYIFETKAAAPIRTNVYWGNAEFIIDDRELGLYAGDKNLGMAGMAVFEVVPDVGYEEIIIDDYDELMAIVDAGLNPTTTNINLKIDGWDGGLMLIPYNTSHKVYRRRGYSSYMGQETHEVIVIDKNGNLDEATPIMFDYPSLSRIKVYKLDPSTAITVEGGVFTTKACQKNIIEYNSETGRYQYIEGTPALSRNLNVRRSFTTVKNVQHFVTDELTIAEQFGENDDIVKGLAPYYGFFTADYAHDVTFDGCILTGRRAYARPGATLGTIGGTGGTYDLEVENSNLVKFVNCEQQNFWITIDSNYNITVATENTAGAIPNMAFITYGSVHPTTLQVFWGIGGSNFSKNLQYIGSTLTRFDAHAGLYNGLIKDSTVTGIALTGNGTMRIENTTYYSPKATSTYNSLISLRSDYGSTWAGDVIVKDVKMYVYTSGNDYSGVFIANNEYINWYYGYQVKFPNISIDNLDLYDLGKYDVAGKTNTDSGKRLQNIPVSQDFKVVLCKMELKSTHENYIEPNKNQMHLDESHQNTIIPIYDGNKNGYIDELPFDVDGDGVVDAPIDLDGNGIAGETGIKYQEAWNEAYAIGRHESGVTLSTFANVNIVQPPEYIKIINNDGVDTDGDGVGDSGGWKFLVAKTDGGGTSNGGWYGIEENFGGFFGCTKFIYGTGENDYVIGTANPDLDNPNDPYTIGAFSFVRSTLQ